MSERVTTATLRERAENVNRRLATTTDRRVAIERRYNYTALDECIDDDGGNAVVAVRTLRTGTPREIGDYLTAMMVALDLSTTPARTDTKERA